MINAIDFALERLKFLTTPPTSYTNGPLAIYPNADDTSIQAAIKRQVLDKCSAVADATVRYIRSGDVPQQRFFSGTEYRALCENLIDDQELPAFLDALACAQSAENLIHRPVA